MMAPMWLCMVTYLGLLFSLGVKAVVYQVISGLPGEHLICRSSAAISCKFDVRASIIYWKIADSEVNTTTTAARCVGYSCNPNPLYSADYEFTVDGINGVSNVTIKNISFKLDNLEFMCDDGFTADPFKPNVVVFPDKTSTRISNNTLDSFIELRVITSCIYPAKSIIITWFSKTKDDQNHTIEKTDIPILITPCTNMSYCVSANKSAYVTSVLKIPKITDANMRTRRSTGATQERTFGVTINYTTGSFSLEAGTFTVKDNTETTTYSTVKLTPTPTIVITSTLITPTQTIVISPTPTTVVSPISTIVVASSSTDQPSSNFTSKPERNKSVIIASSTGGAVTLIIIISAGVCYIKRKRRNKKKAKKHMLSKEDTNVKEIKF